MAIIVRYAQDSLVLLSNSLYIGLVQESMLIIIMLFSLYSTSNFTVMSLSHSQNTNAIYVAQYMNRYPPLVFLNHFYIYIFLYLCKMWVRYLTLCVFLSFYRLIG